MLFFYRHSRDKIYSLKLYHLLNFTLHSKGNACNIGTFIRFYMQMRVEKKTFAYRFYRPFTQQWIMIAKNIFFIIFFPICKIISTFWKISKQNVLMHCPVAKDHPCIGTAAS